MRLIQVFCLFLLVGAIATAKSDKTSNPVTQDFQHENLTFDFMASDGSYWYDCKHDKGTQPHSWTVYCDRFVFKLHILLREYHRENETSVEFHYWAAEVENLKETHTQSTWLTVDKNTKPKKLTGYLGFLNDAAQLRIGIAL